MGESEEISHYDFTGNHPVAWFLSGQALWLSANILWARTLIDPTNVLSVQVGWQVAAPALMLLAFGFENYFKGLIVEDGTTKLARRGHFRKPPGQHHDLVALAKLARFNLNPRQRAVLRLLSGYTEAGRYPILTRVEKYRSTPGLPRPGSMRWTDGDLSVCRKLQAAVQARVKPIWKRYEEAAASARVITPPT